MGRLQVAVAAVVIALAAAPALAGPDGAAEVARITPEEGFIDAAIASDGAGLVAYVAADAAHKAEVRVVEIATGKELRRFDIATVTTYPERLWFVGADIFVVGKPLDAEGEVISDGGQIGVLFDATGKPAKKKFGPAARIVLRGARTKPVVVVKKISEGKDGAEIHQVEQFDLRKGRRVGKVKKLSLIDGRDEKLKFRVNHWTDDGLVAIGIRDGEQPKKSKNDARSPDREGRYDLVDGKGVVATPIADPMAHARRFLVLAKEGGATTFARVADDLTGVEVWRDDQKVAVTLDQKWAIYEPKSLTWTVGDDGTVWLGLSVDPWNRPAVDRKKQDPEHFDVFRVGADGQATRVVRVLAPKKRFTIGATAGHLWLLERNVGFSRGGKALAFYKLP